MSSEVIGTLVGLAVFILLRVVDVLLPKNTHLRAMDRWLVKDDPPPEDEKG